MRKREIDRENENEREEKRGRKKTDIQREREGEIIRENREKEIFRQKEKEKKREKEEERRRGGARGEGERVKEKKCPMQEMFRLYSSTKIIRQCQKREWKVNLQLNMSHCEAISQSAVKEVTATYFIFAEIKFGFTVK